MPEKHAVMFLRMVFEHKAEFEHKAGSKCGKGLAMPSQIGQQVSILRAHYHNLSLFLMQIILNYFKCNCEYSGIMLE